MDRPPSLDPIAELSESLLDGLRGITIHGPADAGAGAASAGHTRVVAGLPAAAVGVGALGLCPPCYFEFPAARTAFDPHHAAPCIAVSCCAGSKLLPAPPCM